MSTGNTRARVPSSDNRFRIGIDLGGTKIESILLHPDGQILNRRRVETPREHGYAAILNAIVQLIRQTARSIPDDRPYSLGMGIPGILDRETGLVINANTTELIGQPLGRDLERRLGRSLAIENDANCFVMAEALQGAGRGYECVFGVIMGTGCGGGLFIKGDVRSGPHGIAGEWGHVSIDPLGPECYCGKRGCIETLISGGGLESNYARETGHKKRVPEILVDYHAGEADAQNVMRRFFTDFGRALGGLISILDPDAIVLGGGLSNIPELYTIGLEKVRLFAFHPQIRTPILKHQMGDSAGVFGAAWIGI